VNCFTLSIQIRAMSVKPAAARWLDWQGDRPLGGRRLRPAEAQWLLCSCSCRVASFYATSAGMRPAATRSSARPGSSTAIRHHLRHAHSPEGIDAPESIQNCTDAGGNRGPAQPRHARITHYIRGREIVLREKALDRTADAGDLQAARWHRHQRRMVRQGWAIAYGL